MYWDFFYVFFSFKVKKSNASGRRSIGLRNKILDFSEKYTSNLSFLYSKNRYKHATSVNMSIVILGAAVWLDDQAGHSG